MSPFRGNANYENLGLLGKGAQGTVFKVKRKSNGEILAMKQVNMKKLSEAQKSGVLKEVHVQILCSLDHPNIVKVHSFEYDDKIQKNYMFIYMELCEGGDLHALIDKRVSNKDYLPEVRIWVIISQLVSALNHMHNRSQSDKSVLNVLHRDIKPENIFLTASGDVRLGDLGLAIRIAQNGSVTGASGTPVYMAPEALSGLRYDQAVDCWSLGCTLLELISFDYLVDGGSSQNAKYILSQIDAGLDTTLPDHYSPELADLINRLLSKKPSERPTAAAMMKEPCVQWGQTQIELDESRKRHKAILRQFKEHQKIAQNRETEKNARIHALEAELLALQNATEAVTSALELREMEMDLREAQMDKRERQLAQIAKQLEDKETKLRQDRAAIEQLRFSSIESITRATIVEAGQMLDQSSLATSESSFSSSVSEVSCDLAEDTISANDSLVGGESSASVGMARVLKSDSTHEHDLLPNNNALRRRANTTNLHKRYALFVGCQPSEIPHPAEASTDHKLPSECDLYEVLKASKRSNIPVSTRMKQGKAKVETGRAKPDLVIETKNVNTLEKPKGGKNASPLDQQVAPPVAPHRYHTRGAARIANKALALRQL